MNKTVAQKMTPGAKLRALLAAPEPFVIAGGGCALHARMVEEAGHECAYMSGGLTSVMIMGLPDAGVITMTEMVENARRMAGAIAIPLIADADQGFGNAVNVRRTVHEYIRAGVAAIHIEDQPFPKRSGSVKGKTVIPLEEAVSKYRAAAAARDELDSDFVIIARCDARGASGGSVDGVITRLRAYKEAGADVLYAEGLLSREEVVAVRAAVDGPLMGDAKHLDPAPSLAELGELGFTAAFYPTDLGVAGIDAFWDLACDVRARGHAAIAEGRRRKARYPMPSVFDLVGFPALAAWEERYLPAADRPTYEGSIGSYDPRPQPTGGRTD